jgi:Sucrase/ferredoxin-like
MTLTPPMRCSALAEQLGEPLAGTVEVRRRWLLLEDRSAWGTDAVVDRFGADAAARAKQLGMRLLLVRRREGDPADGERLAMLVDTEAASMAARTVRGPGDVDVEAAAGMPLDDFGDALTDPILLVCTNGRRDACCALRGRALTVALADEHAERVWECTHLGGHRLSANLVCLPHGIVYGRVAPADGPRLAAAYLAGAVDPEHLRGRSPWPAPAQVAEVAVRRRLGWHGLDDLRLVSATVDGERAEVVLAGPSAAEHRLELRAERLSPPRPISCRADDVESPLHWAVVEA